MHSVFFAITWHDPVHISHSAIPICAQSFANTSGTTLHIRQLAGKNSHHIVECTFKAFARALRVATEYDPRRQGTIASSKGVLTQQ